MWTLLAYALATIVIPTIVVLGLFKAAGLKRAEDVVPESEADEWERVRNYKP
jgi:hypothetical protein